MNGIFQKAFGCEEINKAAIADRGWNPLNRKLLEHPSIASKMEDVSSPNDVLPNLNFVDPNGIGVSVLEHIVRELSKKEGAKKQHTRGKKRDATSKRT